MNKLSVFILAVVVATGLSNSVMAQTDQTITFDSIPNVALDDPAIILNASASSGLPVSFSPMTGNVTISGTTVNYISAGHTTITASQGGDGSYNPAPNVSHTFCINPPEPDIFLSVSNGSVSLTSSSNVGNQWFINNVPYSTDITIDISDAGVYTLQVTIDGCLSRISAPQNIPALQQIITFDPIPDVDIINSPVTPSAVSDAGLPVEFSAATSNIAITNGQVVLLKAGRAIVTASQPGNYLFIPAAPVNQSFCVNPAKPTFTVTANGNGVTLTSSSDTGNQWYLEGIVLAGATNQTLAVSSSGHYAVQVSTADGCLSKFSDVQNTGTFDQTIKFDPIGDVTVTDAQAQLTATSSVGLPIVYVAVTPNVSITNSLMTFLAPGHATVRATQPGNSIIKAAADVEQTFCIKPAKPVITATGTDASGLILSSSNTAATNHWFFNGEILDGAVSQTISAGIVGNYTVQSSVDGCVSLVSAPYAVDITGVEAGHNEAMLTVHPNPASDHVTVAIQGSSSGMNARIRIINLMGIVVHEAETRESEFDVNTSDYSPGIYLVRVNHNGITVTSRFVKR